MSIIAVTGANGHLGRLIVQQLLQKGVAPAELRVTTRNVTQAADLRAQGMDVRHGDFDDFESLRAAFGGSDSLLIISTDKLGSRIEQHLHAVQAAKAAGVKHLAYTSLVKAIINPQTGEEAPLAVEHRATEKAIFESEIPYTILRNSFYAEIFIAPVIQALESGVYVSSTGDTPLGCGARADYAEAAAMVLTQPGHQNKVYEITASHVWTAAELVQTVRKVSGRPLEYRQLSDAEIKGAMLASGVPQSSAQMAVGMNQLLRSGMLSLAAPDLEKILGHAPLSLEDQVRSLLNSAKRA